jgi:hypothetical protein
VRRLQSIQAEITGQTSQAERRIEILTWLLETLDYGWAYMEQDRRIHQETQAHQLEEVCELTGLKRVNLDDEVLERLRNTQ